MLWTAGQTIFPSKWLVVLFLSRQFLACHSSVSDNFLLQVSWKGMDGSRPFKGPSPSAEMIYSKAGEPSSYSEPGLSKDAVYRIVDGPKIERLEDSLNKTLVSECYLV